MNTPRYAVVWSDILATWAALALAVTGAAAIPPRASWPWDILVGLLAAIAIGLAIHRLGCFVHEGVHGNIAPAHLNDRLTNLSCGILTITDVRDYRPLHLAHHRHLGTTLDTERTYFERLDARFVARASTGLHVLSVLRARALVSEEARERHRTVVLVGVLLHVGAVAAFVILGWYVAAVAWCIGVASIFPLVQSLRQLLEHRSDDADGSINYRFVDHEPFTRLFSDDRIGPVIGGAGFNRHLLHHWDPNLSFTWFRTIERWLRQTDAQAIVEKRTSTYGRTFRRLWKR